MNVIHISNSIELIGGTEINIAQLCEQSSKFDIQASWLGISRDHGNYRIKEFPDKAVDLFFGKSAILKPFLKKYLADRKIEVIHAHSISDMNLLRICFDLAPVVRSMHEPRMFCPGQGKFWRNSERICNQPFGLHCFYHAYKEGCCNRHPKRLIHAYKNVVFETTEASNQYKAIIAMSDYMRDEAIKAGIPAEKIKLNPHFTPYVPESELSNTVTDNPKSLLYVGRLSKTKGVHYLIHAGMKLLNQKCNVKIDIIGNGHDESYFKTLVPCEYKERFIFHGWKNHFEIHRIMLKAYLLVFPSIYPEAFGISGIEAMMRAKPVVGFDVGGVSTWLKNGKTGFLVTAKDTEELSNKIKLLLNDQILYHKFCSSAREVAIEEFAPAGHMERLKNIYMDAIDGNE